VLTIKSEILGLNHCHEERKKQHFSFEYKNPYQTKGLSAAAIIAWTLIAGTPITHYP
jgi:hypothetical protein